MKFNHSGRGEKSSKYFLNLEKKQKYKSHIRKLMINDRESTDATEILNEIKEYYSNKYKRESNVTLDECKTYIQTLNLPTLSEADRALIEGPIKLAKIHRALKNMSNNKSPGNDGLPKEFLLAFFDLIGPDLLSSFNSSFDTGLLGASQNQAVITLIEKSGKDNRILSGWRPISLINTDTKIIGKILVSRIKGVLPKLIGVDQHAFIPGRYIGEATRLISDILEYTKTENIGGILFAADFAAAFDSLDFIFLYAVLEFFGFPSDFIRWVHTLYAHSESCVMNFGRTSGYFNLSRGARQGDPLAPYLFLLAIEVLAAKVRKDENVRGININNHIVKQCLFADDASYFLKNLQSLEHLTSVIDEFSHYSSLKLNKLKSEIAWIGSERHSLTQMGEFSWTDLTKKSIKILGIHYTYCQDVSDKLNFDKVINKFANTLNLWKCRQLTIYGRKEIVQTLGISQIYYVSNVLDPPTKNLQQIKQLLTDFIWNGRRPKVKYKSLIGDYNSGGIKLPELEIKIQTQRILWIKKLLNTEYGKWKLIPLKYLSKVIGKNILCVRTNFDVSCIPINMPAFYKKAFHIWSNFSSCNPETPEQIIVQPLWRNKYITVHKESIYFRDIDELDIYSVADIIDHNGCVRLPKELLSDDKYTKCIMQLNSLLTSIPKEWLTTVKRNIASKLHKYKCCEYIICNKRMIEIDKINSNQVYTILLQSIYDVFTAQMNFEKLYLNVEWSDVCSAIYKTSIDARSREFQFKIIHNYLNVNEKLYRWKLAESRLCSYCFTEVESLGHLFCDCYVVKNFYFQVKEWAKELDVHLPSISELIIVYSYIEESDNWYLISDLISLYKQYVFNNRNQGSLNLKAFQVFVNNIKNIEFRIAKKNNKLSVHYAKWGPLYMMEK